MILFAQLLLAHLIGDFFLQSKAGVAQKQERKLRAPYLYLHIAIHVAMVLLLTGPKQWYIALIIGVVHGFIDGLKLVVQTEQTRSRWFFIDQALHLASIVAIVYAVEGCPPIYLSDALLPAAIAVAFLTRPAAFFVGMAMSRWSAIIAREGGTDDALPRAGLYIGILERLMIFGFVLIGQWGAVGFLMAAKSIFRFGDLTRAKDRKLTEYILIGTFLSFGIAIAVGMLFRIWARHAGLLPSEI